MSYSRSLGSDGEVVRHKTTSNYLGWTERKPPGFHDKFDHTALPGGAATRSFEDYVKGCFTPGRIKDEEQRKRDHGCTAASMMRMERAFGPHSLESCEDDDLALKTPLERMYIDLGLRNPEMPANIRHYAQTRETDDEAWKKNNKQTLIDYKDFNSAPLSPYLYQEHPYVRSQDSRIVGSNFVQVTTRPKDRFLEKIDRTLAEVRAMPRFG
ncbi:unnamed protein product, partial [Mesorhabditis spiculigera]